jgi:Flp pilus assembly protein TadG
MKKKNLPNPKHERGQSLVELALSLTIILLLLSGAVTFAMAYFSFLSINDAAQEGAVYGSLAPQDVTGITTHVQNASSNPVNLSQFVSRPMSDCNSRSGNYICVSYTNGIAKDCQGTSSGTTNAITVTVTYRYQIFMPFISAVIGSNTIPLSASATNIILTPLCP